jgi:hypothetical protein
VLALFDIGPVSEESKQYFMEKTVEKHLVPACWAGAA